MKNVKPLLIAAVLLVACGKKTTSTEDGLSDLSQGVRSIDFKKIVGKDYFIDDKHSYIGFKIKYFGYSPVRGRFNVFGGTLFYDEENLANTSVTVTIETESINTGDERRDGDLKKEGSWFDVANFPQIKFQSKEVLLRTDGGFELVGDLTIKGITKQDTLSFEKPTAISKDWAGNDQVDFEGSVVINRQDFGVYGGDFWSSVMENGLTQLSDEVEIELNIHCRRPNYQIRYEDAEETDIDKIILDRIKQNDVEDGIELMDSLFNKEVLSPRKIAAVGYTLNEWQMFGEAEKIFQKRLEFFPEKTTTWIHLGITKLRAGRIEEAKADFERSLELDSSNTRPIEYLRLFPYLNE